MISHVLRGDILESEAQTLVNTVNTVGVMGKGIALRFRQRFPDMYQDYVWRCEQGLVRLGEPYLYRPLTPPWVINFPTKRHWRSVSSLANIIQGLEYLAEHLREWEVESLAVPPLGCGQGQLEWRVVGRTLYRYLDAVPVPVDLYAPLEATPHEATIEFLASQSAEASMDRLAHVSPGHIALAAVAAELGREPHAWPVGHTRFQKLAYFVTTAGVPTGLAFAEGSYGPFSSGLKAVLSRLVNNGVLEEQKGPGNLLRVQRGPTYKDAVDQARPFLNEHRSALRAVTDLLMRLDSRSLEIAATVHFTTGALRSRLARPPSECEVLAEVLRWKARRKPPLHPPEVSEAIRRLSSLGWIEVTESADLPVDDDLITVA